MKTLTHITGIALAGVLLLAGCKQDWEDHYNKMPETVDKNMWEVLAENPDVSMFVEYMQQYELDTLFSKNNAYTLFIPTNDAMEAYMLSDSVSRDLVEYHLSLHFIQSGNIQGEDKIQVYSEKFVEVRRNNNVLLFDGIPLEFESPLYLNGKYFIMNEVANPRPNLYEYFAVTNPVFKEFIDELDSIILDKEKSRPIGFDDDGNTIYDTVAIIFNPIEEYFFPIREEQRYNTATIVFPKAEDYNLALDEMANTLGDVYQDHADIPIDWQHEVLIPYLLEHGFFANSLDAVEFIRTGAPGDTLKLKNILGDSVAIDYRVTDRFDCSNGVAYNFEDFAVPDTLYKGSTRLELEWMVEELGASFAWYEDLVDVQGTVLYSPAQIYDPKASNDTMVQVLFDQGYSGSYSFELKVENLFPRKYLMVVRTKTTFGGLWNVYLNGNLIKTVDYYDYVENPYYYESVVPGKYYFPKNNTSAWDAWAINDQEYGKARVKFEYAGPGEMPKNGIVIDYIDFIPYDD